jgi:hypothetical protein
MQRRDVRLLAAVVCGIALILAVALLLRHHPGILLGFWHVLCGPGRKGWATIVQLVGALVTAAGLASAYSRASVWLQFCIERARSKEVRK